MCMDAGRAPWFTHITVIRCVHYTDCSVPLTHDIPSGRVERILRLPSARPSNGIPSLQPIATLRGPGLKSTRASFGGNGGG